MSKFLEAVPSEKILLAVAFYGTCSFTGQIITEARDWVRFCFHFSVPRSANMDQQTIVRSSSRPSLKLRIRHISLKLQAQLKERH